MHENKKSLSNDRIDILLDIIKNYEPNDSIHDINFRDLFANIIEVNRDQLFFTIVNDNAELANKNTPLLFSDKLDHKEKATIFTTEFGVIIDEKKGDFSLFFTHLNISLKIFQLSECMSPL